MIIITPELTQLRIQALFIFVFAIFMSYFLYTFLKSSMQEFKDDTDGTEVLVRVIILFIMFVINLYCYYAIVTRFFNPEYLIGG